MIPLDHRRDWIEPNHPVLSISEQCRIAHVSRSSFYYQKDADNAKDHEAMKVMDQALSQRLYTGYPALCGGTEGSWIPFWPRQGALTDANYGYLCGISKASYDGN